MASVSGERDFDFFEGAWRVAHRRLRRRLAGCEKWDEFSGRCTMWKTLGGFGNVDDNIVELPAGAYRALTLRSFDPNTRRWAIWWLDGRAPHQLDVPMIGGFENEVGVFYAEDVFEGRAIRVRFLWTQTQSSTPQWAQGFSEDGGAHWETNWVMRFTRLNKEV